jgi:hypothetical protein
LVYVEVEIVMIKINLKDYPKFWIDFADRVNQEIDPSAAVSGQDIKRWMQTWYGIRVHIMHSGSLGEVYMLNKDYTAIIKKDN